MTAAMMAVQGLLARTSCSGLSTQMVNCSLPVTVRNPRLSVIHSDKAFAASATGSLNINCSGKIAN